MEVAKEHSVPSLAFSLLSAGIFRGPCPLSAVLDIGLQTVRMNVYSELKYVVFCAFTEREVETLMELMGRLERDDEDGVTDGSIKSPL